jgi:hypothetical protein
MITITDNNPCSFRISHNSLHLVTDSQQLSGHLDQVRRRHDEGRDAVVMELRAMVNAFQRAKQDHDSATAAQLATLHEALQAHVASADGRQDTLEHNINLAITT